MKKKKQQKRNTRNSKILQDTMVTLGALKESSPALDEMGINEIQVHILDEDGDGVILCLAYDENGELEKTFSSGEAESSFIEEAISEEYDEVFHSSESKPPLLN